MSDSFSPTVQGSLSSSSNSPSIIKDHTLHISPPHELYHKLRQVQVQLIGQSVEERPSWRGLAIELCDTRGMQPLTLQYESQEADNLFSCRASQDGVRVDIWSALSKILSSLTLPDDLPKITFEEVVDTTAEFDSLDGKEPRSLGRLNLIFSSHKVMEHVRKELHEIQISRVGRPSQTYTLFGVSTTVPGDVFVFDCLNLSIPEAAVESLFSALTEVTAPLGSLLGLVKTVVVAKESDFQSDCDIIRGYVKLKPQWMLAPLEQLALALPTHLKWKGIPRRLLHPGTYLLSKTMHSEEYPQGSQAGGETAPVTAAGSADLTGGEVTQSEVEATQPPRAAKKRKTRKT